VNSIKETLIKSLEGRKWKDKWQNSCQNTVIIAKKAPLKQKGAETTNYSALSLGMPNPRPQRCRIRAF
jgi:hypothetical protein